MDWNSKTIETYDQSAGALAEYFKGIGARVDDIERAIGLACISAGGRAVEIGCGDGRDASEIVKRVDWYEGFDPSNGMLEIARKALPETSFVLADALSYDYPEDLDIVFAFASLLHVNKNNMPTVIEKVSTALRPGGIFYVSLKERDEYSEETKSDKYGERMFYYYNSEILKQMTEGVFSALHEDRQTIGDTNWFTIALQKS